MTDAAPAREKPANFHDGWMDGACRIDSPNFDDRPAGTLVSLVVIHAISLPPGQFGGRGIEDLFTNKLDPTEHPYFAQISSMRVSAHFLIRRNGDLLQFVSCDKRAWHAGRSSWSGRDRCNDFSIGVELEGDDQTPFDEAQYDCLADLLRALSAAYPLRDIAGHSEVAPGRKTDPGPWFEWQRVSLPGAHLSGGNNASR